MLIFYCVCEDNDKRQSNLIIKSKKHQSFLNIILKNDIIMKKIFKLDQFKKNLKNKYLFLEMN